jgi:hypothetical protein
MDENDELKGEIERLKKELALLKSQDSNQYQGMIKKKAEIAGEITDKGIFEEEIKKVGFSTGFDKEELKVTSYFSIKGHKLDKEKVCRCSICSLLITDVEKIEINNKIYCDKCYRKEEHDLGKDEFKILICILNGFTSISLLLEYFGYVTTIQKIAGLPRDIVKTKIEKLLDRGYLFLYGLIFKNIRVTSMGEEALVAYNQIYRDEDCDLMKERIKRIGGYR